MNNRIIASTLAALLTVLAAKVAAFEEIGKLQLEPMERPSQPDQGMEFHWLKNGKPHSSVIKSVNGDAHSAENSEGCGWTSLSAAYAPSLTWRNCNGSTGTQKIRKTKGSPWPMKAKEKFSYTYSGSDAKYNWQDQRRCKVKGAVRVRVPAGEFDTYKVVCSDKWNTRTWWTSPKLGHSVAFRRQHKRDSTRSYTLELVKTVSPLQ